MITAQTFIGVKLLASQLAQPTNKAFEIYDSRLAGFTSRVQPTGHLFSAVGSRFKSHYERASGGNRLFTRESARRRVGILKKSVPRNAHKLDLAIRRWLSKTPDLLAAYLVWHSRTRERRGLYVFATLALFVAWVVAASLYVHADRATAASTLARLHRHDLFWTTITTIVSAVLVSRRRALTRSKAPRVWTAALPIERSAARWQAIASDSLPAILLACILAATFGGMSLATLFGDGTSAPIITWAATTGGVLLGAALSCLWRPAKQEDSYEGSRYVPHRRRTETPIPTGTLAALGSWPIRQTFASARPKTVARVMVPIMLAVPLGSQAADVMVTLGLLTSMGAVVALIAAVILVSTRASRWLMPLPLDPIRLARRTLGPALASMLVATSIESWLIWVLGSSIRQSFADGILTLAASVILAVFGCLLAIRVNNNGAYGRL